jgi:polar amino acid transport system substrate-binding protein
MKKAILLCALLVIHLSGELTQADSLTIVYPPEKNAFHDAAAAIIREAYKKIGTEVVFKTYPAERALQISNSGDADGELVRIDNISTTYTNLIKIPVSHVVAEQMAFAKGSIIEINGWESLRPYKIVFHKGYKAAELGTKGMDVLLVGHDKQAFLMVDKGRRDVVVANRFTGLLVIKEMNLNEIVMLTPPVQVDPLFHYLHKKHKALVPQITAMLRKMKHEGKFQEIYKQFQVFPLTSLTHN